jgi:hypothetical protein
MEFNGLMTYDRKVIKGNATDFFAVNQRVINENRYYTDIVSTSEEVPQTWKYTTTQPAGNWFVSSFDDSAWSTGNGGFGTEKTPGAIIGTVWNTSDIWLRREFTLPADALDSGKKLVLKVHHDEDCQIYINGVKALDLSGYTGNYAYFDISSAAKSALILGGNNTLAVHCHQTTGGQYIDAGISTLLLQTPSGIENVKKKDELIIFPNPVSNELKLANYELGKVKKLRFVALLGSGQLSVLHHLR